MAQVVDTLGSYLSKDHNTVNLTKDGKCTSCGGCCSNCLELTDDEIFKIKEYVKRNNIQPHKIVYPTCNPTVDATCPFLDLSKKTERCKIYSVRPYICRMFNCSKPSLLDYPDKIVYKMMVHVSNAHLVDMRKTFFTDT